MAVDELLRALDERILEALAAKATARVLRFCVKLARG